MYTLIDGVQFYDKDEVDDLFAQNGSTSLSGRLDQEVIDRAAADDALGTRIDQEADRLTQESNARLLGDQTLTNQLTAIEQLWSTLVSANFIDTDSNTIVVDDSGKSVRQIAHDEFYRQLVTDADNVKQQLDTLKELADYLQNNPTILTDIYTKLGLTWSLDTPTDFGTFDFSRVLAATDVDSAIVELHNALTNKVGDLTQLTTTFKGNLVGAINEVKALAVAGGGGGGGGADTTQLEAKLNAEIAARTQADTDLGNRITANVGTLSSLTTTAKDNLVAAVNEVKALAEAGGGGGDTTQLEAELNAEVTARTQADTALGTRIDGEVTARTQADTALGTRIDGEVTARTQADTALDNKITANVGTLSSLTTTAKTNLVAAVNEVQSEVNTATSTANTNKTAIGTLSSLTTTAKNNLVAAVNEVQSEVNTATSTANTATSTANTNKTAIGTLSSLTTTAKTNLVAAINEVQSEVNTATSTANTAKTAIGTLSSLTTTAKGNLVAAVNEVQTAIKGKQDSLVSKTYTMPTLTTSGTRYIKIATCLWNTATTIHCVLSGDNFEDNVYINICGGNGQYADSCGWYTTHGKRTHAVIIKRAAKYAANFEVWLKFTQLTTLSVRLYAEKQYSGILNTDTSLNITATAPSGSIVEHSLIDNYSGFFGNISSANDNTYRYTFVVDSNAKLTAWANNDRSGGKDYTSVLIRKGTWTSSKGVNLTAAGTKVVVGEAGSKLVFNTGSAAHGIYYLNGPSDQGCYIQGVTMQCSNSGFYNCINLTNCYVSASSTGFDSCSNLSHCVGVCRGDGNVDTFLSCTKLTNCTGHGLSTDGSSSAFSACSNITNCSGTTSATVLSYSFANCNSVTNCASVADYTGNDCTSVGFNGCANISNCIGTGTGSTAGAGFAACTGVAHCKAGGHCTTGVFVDCYASSTKNSTYACADTANGGFNNTTNPAA